MEPYINTNTAEHAAHWLTAGVISRLCEVHCPRAVLDGQMVPGTDTPLKHCTHFFPRHNSTRSSTHRAGFLSLATHSQASRTDPHPLRDLTTASPLFTAPNNNSSMEEVMRRRRKEASELYEQQWDEGRGSHHPDFDPDALDEGGAKATRCTEELYNAIVKNDVARVYDKIEEGADVDFVFGPCYSCPEGYTCLMVAAHRGRLECARALLRAGADPNYVNGGGDLALFWAIDGGVEMIKLFLDFGADPDVRSPKGWTALSYAKAKGKYGATEEKGVYPEDVLLYYGASEYGAGPAALGTRSPRQSYNPEDPTFSRERGSYQAPYSEP